MTGLPDPRAQPAREPAARSRAWQTPGRGGHHSCCARMPPLCRAGDRVRRTVRVIATAEAPVGSGASPRFEPAA